MAVPTFQALTAAVAGTGTAALTLPSHATDDIFLIFVESSNQVVSMSVPAGFMQCASSPQGTGTAGGTTATRMTTFWSRATSASMANPTVGDPGEHIIAQVMSFRGCKPAETLATDDFTRSDSADLGADWTPEASSLQIVGNEVRPGEINNTCWERYNAITWPNDQWASCIIRARPAGPNQGGGPCVRLASGAETGYTVQCDAAGARLLRWVAGSLTSIGTFTAPAVGDTVRLEVVNQTLRVLVNSVVVLTVVDTQIASGQGGLNGINPNDGDCELDSFAGGAMHPYHATTGNVAASASTSVTIPGVTTTVADCLIVMTVCNATDTTADRTGAVTNANLTGITERDDTNTTQGNGGGFAVITGTKATAGAVGNSTCTLATSSVQGRWQAAFAGALNAYTLACAPVAVAITAAAAAPLVGHLLSAAAVSVGLTVAAASPLYGRTVLADAVSVALTPADATLEYTPGLGAYLLECEPVSLALTPAAAGVTATRLLATAPVSVALTASDAGVTATRLLATAPVDLALTASAATLTKGFYLGAAPVTLGLTPADAQLVYEPAGAYILACDPVAVSLAASAADALRGYYLATAPVSLALTIAESDLLKSVFTISVNADRGEGPLPWRDTGSGSMAFWDGTSVTDGYTIASTVTVSSDLHNLSMSPGIG